MCIIETISLKAVFLSRENLLFPCLLTLFIIKKYLQKQYPNFLCEVLK